MVLSENSKIILHVRQTFASAISGFVETEDVAFKITLHKEHGDLVHYYVYQGGKNFTPTVPQGQANPGDVLTVSVDSLPLNAFVENLPAFQLSNQAYLSWLADSVVAEAFGLSGNMLSIDFIQNNPFSKLSSFRMFGEVRRYPGSSTNYGGAYAEFTLSDYAGRLQRLRLRYNGFDTPELQLVTRGLPYTIKLVSCDGLRLSIVYSKDNKVVTIHLCPPSGDIYVINSLQPYSGTFLDAVGGMYTGAFISDEVQIARFEEKAMLLHGDEYTAGRIGAEIAYVIATLKLGLMDVILQEPSVGGRDLFTRDNAVAIQRTLVRHPTVGDLLTTVQSRLAELVHDLARDYRYQPKMIKGYAIVSFLDIDRHLRSVILDVPRPRHLSF